MSDTHDPTFALVLQRVRALQGEDDEPCDEPPTPYALERTLALLEAAYPLTTARPFPYATPAADENGEISLYWFIAGERSVQLTVGADESQHSYLYHRQGRSSALDRTVTPEALAAKIDWYAEALPTKPEAERVSDG